MAFTLNSSAFKHDRYIPEEYTCISRDISPPLQWHDAPSGTQSFVLIMDDPDAPSGTWDHWLLYNIPAHIDNLTENMTQLPEGTLEGKNSWQKTGYGGPCPPTGEHRYFFKLYALDNNLALANAASKSELENAMQGHILAQAKLMGRFAKPPF